MKDYIIPYIVGNSKPWKSGIDIYNHSDADYTITIKIYEHKDGNLATEFKKDITKYGHVILGSGDISKGTDKAGRAHIIITGPDNLMVTPFIWLVDDYDKPIGFGIPNVYEDTNLKN